MTPLGDGITQPDVVGVKIGPTPLKMLLTTEHGKPIVLPLGKQAARCADSTVGKGK